MATRYVLGFFFNEDLSSVLLIEKNRPAWQAGKLNGIGGHIEDGETPSEAMEREFSEETGLTIKPWRKFLELTDDNHFHITAFFAVALDEEEFEGFQSMTDEKVAIAHTDELLYENVLPNLRWMIPMALSFKKGERALSFNVLEQY